MEIRLNPGNEVEVRLTIEDMHRIAQTFDGWVFGADPGGMEPADSVGFPVNNNIRLVMKFVD